MAKRRRLIFLAMTGGLLVMAFGPALLILAAGAIPDGRAQPGSAGATAPAITSQPSATAPAPAIIPRPTLARDQRPAPSLAACKVSAGRVFLRAAPRRASRALGVLAQGQRLLILATPTDPYQNRPTPTLPAARWLPVRAGALTGWVYSTYCEPLEANR